MQTRDTIQNQSAVMQNQETSFRAFLLEKTEGRQMMQARTVTAGQGLQWNGSLPG